MSTKGFTYNFSLKELTYFLFKRKTCPKCGGKLIKDKCSEIVEGSKISSHSTPLYIHGREVTNYYYLFKCEKCSSEFTLKELSKR